MNLELIRATMKKAQTDEGMEQIIELLINYNVNNETYLNDAIYHLLYYNTNEEEE